MMQLMQTITLILTSYLTHVSCKVFLFRLEGEVNSQEFVYYKIMHPGNLLLVLESQEGDADVYVSEKTPSPTYHPDSYDFHSATCGTDSVTIPKNLKRPMAVGIYGYAANNKFTMEVYQMPDGNDNYYYDEEENFRENHVDNNENTITEKKETRKTTNKVKKKLKNIPNGLWPFLELFEMLFL